MALGSLLASHRSSAAVPASGAGPLVPKLPARKAKAKAVIHLGMSGGPPQHDLFDWKPKLVALDKQPCPAELLTGQRFAFIRGVPKLLGTPYQFAQHGHSGAWVSELLPHFSKVVDEVAFIKAMHTNQFNHAPAELLMHTGSAIHGHASIGSWVMYGLGSENQNLPGFVVLGDFPTGQGPWNSGFLPSINQGVRCRSGPEPVLYLSDPPGIAREDRRRCIDTLRRLYDLELAEFGDPETVTRIAQYELAFRMQMAAPEVMDISRETNDTLKLYGAEPGAVSFANNCLLARRLVERGVRYVQLFSGGWDMHGTVKGVDDLMEGLPKKCREIDQGMSALLIDLKSRGLLEETLVVWGGEFGRTSMKEERDGTALLGRDHHPLSFTIWMAGAGVKSGITYGATDELGYFGVEDQMDVRDLHATLLHLLGFDPEAFSYLFQGLRHRLIGPAAGPRVHHFILR